MSFLRRAREATGAYLAGIGEFLHRAYLRVPLRGRREVILAALAVAALVGGVITLGVTWQRPPPSGELVVGHLAPILDLDPSRVTSQSPPGAVAATSLLFETLVARTRDGRIIPSLARSWRVSSDGREIRFKLHSSRRFAGGGRVDAEAVRASLLRLRARTSGGLEGSGALGLGPLTEIVVEADYQILVRFAEPYPAIWSALSAPAAGIVAVNPEMPGGLAGCGPYKVERWDRVSGMLELVTTRARPARVVFRLFEGESALLDAATGGRVDVALGVSGPGEGKPLGNGAVVKSLAWSDAFYIGLNVRGGAFAQAAVRHAAASAVDRDDVVHEALPARARPNERLWPDEPGANERVGQATYYPEDTAQARRALAQAGWTREGKRLEVEIICLRTRADVAIGAAVARQWTSTGFAVTVTTLDPAPFSRRLAARDFDAFVLSYRWPDEGILYDLLHSSQEKIANYAGYQSPQADRLLERLVTEVTPELRRRALLDAERIVLTDAPWIPLAVVESAAVIGAKWPELLFGPRGEFRLDVASRPPF
jgi:peptide/nickel transport system substrate-binding protein